MSTNDSSSLMHAVAISPYYKPIGECLRVNLVL